VVVVTFFFSVVCLRREGRRERAYMYMNQRELGCVYVCKGMGVVTGSGVVALSML